MEQQVEVEIVRDTTTAQYGALTVGAILRTGASYAAHLVDDCMAAKYVPAAGPAAIAETAGIVVSDDVVQTSAQTTEARNTPPPAVRSSRKRAPAGGTAATTATEET